MLEAKPDCCQATALGMGDAYIPCNKPATKVVKPKGRGEGSYRMCDMCADHSLRNRGFKLVGSYKTSNNAALEAQFEAEGKGARITQEPTQRETPDQLIENKLLAMLHDLNKNKPDAKKAMLSCDSGTAYLSTIVSPKITERDAYLDFVLDNWDTFGNAMLQLSAPQKDAVEEYLTTHEGQLPPGVVTSAFTRVNIRRS
jgi:hypothetical protein